MVTRVDIIDISDDKPNFFSILEFPLIVLDAAAFQARRVWCGRVSRKIV
jgi:hypothetical protein